MRGPRLKLSGMPITDDVCRKDRFDYRSVLIAVRTSCDQRGGALARLIDLGNGWKCLSQTLIRVRKARL